jgi:RNA polymerase sigma-70 factor (ECF subfamily)
MAHDAEDVTQSFFERVLSRDYLRAVDRSKGKFRCFLLAMVRHFLANHRREARAQKRGGNVQFVSIDSESVDEIDLGPGTVDGSAEKSFDRQWALTLLEKVVAALRMECQASGKAALFERLKTFLTGEKAGIGYADLAASLNTTEAALKMSISRLRRRYGELLRAEIARTVSTPEEVEEELRALFAARGKAGQLRPDGKTSFQKCPNSNNPGLPRHRSTSVRTAGPNSRATVRRGFARSASLAPASSCFSTVTLVHPARTLVLTPFQPSALVTTN